MRYVMRVVAVLGLILGGVGSATATAAPITVTGSAVNLSALGDAIGTQFDYLNVHAFGPVAITVPHGVPTPVTLSDFDFIVGINANVPHAGYLYTLNVPFTVDGVSGVLSQPFVLDINTSDTIAFLTGSPTLFHTPSGSVVSVTLLAQNPVTVGPFSGTFSGHLSAQVVEMPEPATLAIFGAVALAGLAGYRRRKAGV